MINFSFSQIPVMGHGPLILDRVDGPLIWTRPMDPWTPCNGPGACPPQKKENKGGEMNNKQDANKHFPTIL